MPIILASAPGKIILFGEHAVVYDRPAIAIPVHQLKAKATINALPAGPPGKVLIEAPEIGLRSDLDELPGDDPLAIAIRGVMEILGVSSLPSLRIHISSTIPVAAGLGSGAAVSVAIIRALSSFLGHSLADPQVNAIAYRVEQRLHGTPSGIDNTVITYAQPIFFRRSQGFQTLEIGAPFTFVIGDSGIISPTRETVGDVRRWWEEQPTAYETIFDQIGSIVLEATSLLRSGDQQALGSKMDANHACLQKIGVSCPELDGLVEAARSGGAFGAKLSGGGRGGNMIALVEPEQAQKVASALRQAGAVRTIVTNLAPERV